MAGYHQVLIRRNHANETLTFISANRIGVGFIAFAIESDAKMFQTTTGLPSHWGGFLADTTGENQLIETAQCGGESTDLLSELIVKQLHPHGSGLCRSAFFQHA